MEVALAVASLVVPGQISHLWGLQFGGNGEKLGSGPNQPLLLRRRSHRTPRTIPCTPR